MVNEKGKGIVSSSSSSPKHNGAANNSQSEMTIMKNGEETWVASEENAFNKGANEENAVVVMNNGKIAMEEEKNEETEMEEEDEYEESSMEEDEKNEHDALGEDDDEEDGTEEEDEAGDQVEEVEEEEEEEEEEKEENEIKANQQAKIKENVAADAQEIVKKSRKRGRKEKVVQGGSQRVASKLEDTPGSSSKKKASKRVESMGMIFMCSSKTKKDCFRFKVFGLPESKRDVVHKIYKGMRLFLFDFDLRLMYGIYKAAGPGGYNIEPKAFKSAYPSQVRFTILEDCLPLAEEKFRTVIKDNYYTRNKFDCQLNSKQVKNLCKLFAAASRGSKSDKSGRRRRAENHRFVNREQTRRPERERRSALGEDHRYRDHPVMYERERRERFSPLSPPPAPAPVYASYGRALEVDPYRHGPLVERRDHRSLDLDLRYRDVVERRDHRNLDSDLRYRDEIVIRDPYISYRDPPPYRDPLYSVGLPPGYNPPVGLQAEYPPLAGTRYEYRHPAAAPSEYGRPLRRLYRY